MTPSDHRPVLITGAGGFIGKDVVSRLLARGWRVRAMVRRAGGTGLPSHERLEVVTADMRDEVSLRAAVKGVAAVVHLVAAKSDEKDSDDVNVGGAKRLVAVCRADG